MYRTNSAFTSDAMQQSRKYAEAKLDTKKCFEIMIVVY